MDDSFGRFKDPWNDNRVVFCGTCGAPCDVVRPGKVQCNSCGYWCDRIERLEAEIDGLAKVLLEEFGGPIQDESACEMAVRVLREQRALNEEDTDVTRTD